MKQIIGRLRTLDYTPNHYCFFGSAVTFWRGSAFNHGSIPGAGCGAKPQTGSTIVTPDTVKRIQ